MAFQAEEPRAGIAAQVVVGLFSDVNEAHQAITQLRANGFRSHQIGAAFRDQAPGHERNAEPSSATARSIGPESWWEKIKEAFRPGDSPEPAHAETSFPAEGYDRSEYEYDFASEDFEGSLTEAGISPARAAYLTRSLAPGGAIVTVRDADRAKEAEAVLSANGAHVRYEDAVGQAVPGAGLPLNDQGLAGSAGLGAGLADANSPVLADPGISEPPVAAANSVDYPAAGNAAAAAGDRIQLFGEVLRVHKDRINRGEVRIRKDVIAETQTIEVPVTREELLLERIPVAGDTPAPGALIGEDQEIRVPLSEESVRLEKQPVLREEVVVGKRDVSEVATLTGNVRHEELKVDSDVDAPRRAVAGEELPGEERRRG